MTAALGAARSGLGFAAFVFAVAAAACARDIELGSDGAQGGSAGAGGNPSASGGYAGTAGNAGEIGVAGEGENGCVRVACHGKYYACGNCSDDDGDGKVDAADPECTGPCDNNEANFDVDLPGASADKCTEDCFFDNGNGSGNDGCRFSFHCDPLSVAPDYPPSGLASCAYDQAAVVPGGGTCADLTAAQAPTCGSVCGPLTPNGCDCFGCCEIPANSKHFVALAGGASECSMATLADPSACPPCTQVPSCTNPCEDCERCVGRPEPLPSCNGGGGCDGPESCDETTVAPCAKGFYCITGCCVPEPR